MLGATSRAEAISLVEQGVVQLSKERYEEVKRFLREKFAFLALKATLLCLRGSRGIMGVNSGLEMTISV